MGIFFDKPTGPSPQETSDVQRGYWESYSRWQGQAKTNYESDLASAQARMGVGGIKPGTPAYQAQVSAIEGDYAKRTDELASGPTAKLLNQYFNEQRDFQVWNLQKGELPSTIAANADYYDTGGPTGPVALSAIGMAKTSQAEFAGFGPGGDNAVSVENLKNMSMEQWYQGTFGNASKTGEDVAAQATAENVQNAKLSAGGQSPRGQGGKASSAVSPWW